MLVEFNEPEKNEMIEILIEMLRSLFNLPKDFSNLYYDDGKNFIKILRFKILEFFDMIKHYIEAKEYYKEMI